MKKILFFVSIVLIYSCNTPCTIAQLQNQVINPGPNCTAILPDYRTMATITFGCTGGATIQIPTPGTVVNKTTSVIIKSTGTNGKSSQISFVAIFADTITPKIIFPLAQVGSLLKVSNRLYDIADNMIGEIDRIQNNTFPFDSFPGMVREDSFKGKLLVIASLDSAGHRKRFITYMDSLEIPIYSVIDTTALK